MSTNYSSVSTHFSIVCTLYKHKLKMYTFSFISAHYSSVSTPVFKPTFQLCSSKYKDHLSHVMKKQHFVYAKIKTQISTFVFAAQTVQFILEIFQNLKFPVCSDLLCLYMYMLGLCRTVLKPHCWFSHDVAHLWIRRVVYTISATSQENLMFAELRS